MPTAQPPAAPLPPWSPPRTHAALRCMRQMADAGTRELLHVHDEQISYMKEMLTELRNHRAVRGRGELLHAIVSVGLGWAQSGLGQGRRV